VCGDQPLSFGVFEDFFLMGKFDHVHNKQVTKNTCLAGLSTNLDLAGIVFFKLSLLARNDPTITEHTQQTSPSWNYLFTFGGENISIDFF
tara:strand:+ start:929 stop:1198 length:270 start_codon:yes stop_codon:yes gene_type:complete